VDAAPAAGETGLTPHRRKLREMLRNRHWIAAHIEELIGSHRDRWIVVAGQSVIGAGDTAEGAIAACGREIDEVEAIVLLVPAEIHRLI
jgi:hypothetical protein